MNDGKIVISDFNNRAISFTAEWLGPIDIGPYHIAVMSNGNIWIGHNSGEGAEFSRDKVEKLIDAFYKENF